MIYKWFLWLACLAGGGVEALSLHQLEKPAIVKIPVQRAGNVATRLQKRISTVSAPFEVQEPEFARFFSNVTIGTPPQEIQVRLDTSSGYLAITASNSNYCESTNKEGYFNISSSSTYQVLDHDFNATYYQGHILTGDFANEKVAINGAIIPAMELGVNFGIDGDNFLGLGYLVGPESDAPARILQALMKTGDIKSAAYSLWMDDSTGTTGSILFGGVNTAKYVGELHTMSIPAINGVHHLPVALVTGVAVQAGGASNSTTSDLPFYVALDSAVSWTYLPDGIVEQIYKDLGAWYYGDVGRLNCTTGQKGYNVTFTFTDFDISIPVSDFILGGDGEICIFSIVPSGGQTAVLGATFLQSIYVVYDLSNNEISIAPTNFSSGEDNILEIGSGSSTISGAVSVSVTASATVPTTVIEPNPIRFFPPTSVSSAQSATSTSKGGAIAPTGSSNKVMAGLIGAGLLIAL